MDGTFFKNSISLNFALFVGNTCNWITVTKEMELLKNNGVFREQIRVICQSPFFIV
jgi:hypothetical protein